MDKYHPVPKEDVVLKDAIIAGFTVQPGNLMKVLHCTGKKDAAAQLADYTSSLENPDVDGLIVTFEDGVTYDVVRVIGVLDRGPTHHGSLRYYLLFECNLGDCAVIANEVVHQLFN